MPDAPKPITGHCLCGAVTYRADAEPIAQATCHCADCQRQSGSPFSVVVAVPTAALEVQGDTIGSHHTIGEDHGGRTERQFCTACGSPLFSFSPMLPDVALIKAGTLDDASWLEPAAEFWTSSAQPWAPRLERAAAVERGPA